MIIISDDIITDDIISNDFLTDDIILVKVSINSIIFFCVPKNDSVI